MYSVSFYFQVIGLNLTFQSSCVAYIASKLPQPLSNMKKSLLPILLLGCPALAHAQVPTGPWREVNTTSVGGGTYTNPNYAIDQLVTLSPTFTWGLAYDAALPAGSPVRNKSVRVINAAGTDFDFNDITGTAGFQATNISVPAGVPNNLTAVCGQFAPAGASSGGEVVRTTTGGLTWRKISTAAMFAVPGRFCQWAYLFDANAGVAVGDPTPALPGAPTSFECWYTTNASTPAATAVTWTRASAPAPLDANETLRLGTYAAVGSSLWAGTAHLVNGVPGPCRVLRSTDRGHTWTAYATPMTMGEIQHLAFKDALHGLAYTHSTTAGSELMTTADGGLTWTLQTLPDPTTADSLRGRFYWYGVAAIPNVGFMSFGGAVARPRRLSEIGASFSCEGIGKSWVDVDKGRRRINGYTTYFSASFMASGNNGYSGYFGSVTPSNPLQQLPYEPGGFFQVNAGATTPACLLPNRAAATALFPFTISPNPSLGGRFRLNFTETVVPGTQLAVFDALGRLVLQRNRFPTGFAPLELDLSKVPAGLYILHLTSSAGTAAHKLVVE